MFSFSLTQVKETLGAGAETLRGAINERVAGHGGKLVGGAVGATIARRVVSAVNLELDKIGPDSSEIRDSFDEWVRNEITKLETDPARAAELGEALKGVLAHETVQAWIWDVWARMRRAVEIDAANPNSRSVAVNESELANPGEVLGLSL